MIKRILVANIIWMLTIGFNVLPAQAYTELKTPVSISASGTLTGTTLTFTASVVSQGTGTAQPSVSLTSPSGITDSGEALKVTGGTNELGARIIIYTDNNNNTVLPNKAPTVNPGTGIDGGGLVGQTDPAYTTSLFWGIKSAVDYDPNTNSDYAFDGNMDDGVGEVYIVDKRHTHSFTTKSADPASLDCKELYKFDGTLVANTDNDGLYPQAWDYDLYDSATDHTEVHRVSPALYSSIATVASGIATGSGADALYYVCSVPKLTTVATDDSVKAKLGKIDATPGDNLYIAIGGDFRGKPSQTYSTAQLNVAVVKD